MKKKLNKDVRLTLVGENTEVDKTVVDSNFFVGREARKHKKREDLLLRIIACRLGKRREKKLFSMPTAMRSLSA